MKQRESQKNFYPACFEYLKAANRTWTVVADADEYVYVNPNYVADDGEVVGQHVTGTEPSKMAPTVMGARS